MMKVINFSDGIQLTEAVRLIKSESYKTKERVVGEFNNFILDSNKSEEDNLKAYRSQWNKLYDENGVDWEQRRYEISKDVLPAALRRWSNKYNALTYTMDNAIDDTMKLTDMLIEKLKEKKND